MKVHYITLYYIIISYKKIDYNKIKIEEQDSNRYHGNHLLAS